MQANPLLEQIDWFFTSPAWTTQFPLSLVIPLAKVTSDHLPYNVQIGSNIPKANIFRFENFWLAHPDCIKEISDTWKIPCPYKNSAHTVNAKFKLLRRVLKLWAKKLSNLSQSIGNCNLTVAFLDRLEEF